MPSSPETKSLRAGYLSASAPTKGETPAATVPMIATASCKWLMGVCSSADHPRMNSESELYVSPLPTDWERMHTATMFQPWYQPRGARGMRLRSLIFYP